MSVVAAHLFGLLVAQSVSPCDQRLYGTVLDREFVVPIDGAVVILDGARTATQAAGVWEFDGVCPGERTLAVRLDGYAPTSTVVTVPRQDALELRLEPTLATFVVQGVVRQDERAGALEVVVEGEALAAQRGASLADALEGAGGARVQRSGGIARPIIDGFGSNRLVIINHGLRHHAHLWGLDHAPEVDPFAAHRIRVVRGASGVRYGADAMGGVILLEPAPFPDAPGIGGELNLAGDYNGGQGALGVMLRGALSDPRWGYRVQGSVKKAGALSTPDYALDNTGVEEANVSAGLGFTGERWTLSLDASRFATRLGVFTGQVSDSPSSFADALARGRPLLADLYTADYEISRPKQEVWHLLARAAATYRLERGGTIAVVYGLQHNSRREFDIVRNATNGAQVSLQLTSHSLEVTWDHAWNDQIDGTVGVTGLLQLNDHESRRLIPDYLLAGGSVFAIERYHGRGYRLDVGLRYERQGANTEAPARVAPTKNPPIVGSTSFEAVMAGIGVEADPAEALVVEARLATAARIPSMNELFIDGPSQGQGSFERGDASLDVEQTLNLSLAARFVHNVIDVQLHGYLHAMQDFVSFRPILDAAGVPVARLTIAGAFPAFEYVNVDALQFGGHAEVKLRPWPQLELTSRVSYTRAHDLTSDAPLLFIPADRYQNRVTFRPLGFDPLDSSSLYVESVLTARQTDVDPTADFLATPEAHHLLNLGLATTVTALGRPLEVRLDLENVLDARYRDYLSRLRYFADEPGFSASLRVRVPFDVEGG